MSRMKSLREVFSFMQGNVLVITVTRVLGMFVRRMVFPYASLFILALGGESEQIGFINSLRPLAGLIMFPIAGYLADRAGRVKMIAMAGYLSGFTLLLYVLAPSWEWIALGALIQGFMVFHFPPTSAMIADSLTPENRGTGIATMNTVASTLAIVSPYIAGVVITVFGDNFGMRILYGVLLVANFVSATISLIYLRETTEAIGPRISLSNVLDILRDAYGGIPSTLKQLPKSIKAMMVILVLGFISNAVASPFWVVYAIDQIGLSSVEWGTILLIESALRTITYIPAGLLVDRYGRTKSLVAALLISLFSMPLFVFSTRFIEVLLIRMAIAITNVLFIPACSALMADTIPRNIRGRVMAAMGRGTVFIGATGGGTGGPGMGFMITIPVVVASIIGGYIYASNPAFPWYIVTVAIFASLIVSLFYIREPKEAEI